MPSSKPSQLFKRIVWAVDTLEPIQFQKNAQFVLGALSRGLQSEILPVHIFSYLLPESDPSGNYEQAYLALAEKRMQQLRQNADLENLREGKIITSQNSRVRDIVNKVLDYAQSVQADSIVLATHSHSTLENYFLGSFAETLLLKSNLPVVTVNPKTKVRERISKVLFPTSFEERFQEAFEKTVQLCAATGAGITILYKQPYIPILGPSMEFQDVIEAEKAYRKSEGERFVSYARERKVPAELHLDFEPGNVVNAITEYAQKSNIDLIALVSQTSHNETPRVGSVCRNVVRKAECPVWIFRTDDSMENE